MSYWGAQVIINLFGTIPGIGEALTEWIRGDYGIGDATLNRFFSLHVIALPFLIALLVMLHLVALRQVGSNNPDGIEIKEKLGADGKPLDGIPFHPYYTLKDIVGVGLFLTLFAIVVFFVPTFGGLFLEPPNFEPANPTSTPEHIAPVWYFTPYYAILRAVPDQKLGALLMALSVLAFLFLPWLDRAKNKSIRYRGWPRRCCSACSSSRSWCSCGWVSSRPTASTCCGAHLHDAVFRVLHRPALRVQGRRRWPGSESSDLPCSLSSPASPLFRAVVGRRCRPGQ